MLRVGLIGEFQVGKSTLINCFLEGFYASIGNRVATTHRCTEYRYGSINRIIRKKDNKIVDIDTFFSQSVDDNTNSDFIFECNSEILKHVTIVDTPGINANDEDSQTTIDALKDIELGIVIISNNGISQQVTHFISQLQYLGVPYVIVMNCHPQGEFDTWIPESDFNKNIADECVARLQNQNIEGFSIGDSPILLINAKWYLASLFGIENLYKKKKDHHLRILQDYLLDVPSFDYRKESNVDKLISFLCCSINHYPFELYRKFAKSQSDLDKIILLGFTYKTSVKRIFERELDSLNNEISLLNKILSQFKANEDGSPRLPKGLNLREWQIFLLSIIDRKKIEEKKYITSYTLSKYELERKHIATALAQIQIDAQDKII